jgi:hypothetical protein
MGNQETKLAYRSPTGAYRCVAKNPLGSSNTACQVAVKAKKEEPKREGAEPFFTRGLVDQYVDRGATMVFSCAVSGDPEPEIKWFRNGQLLKPSDRIGIEQLPGGECRLTIKDCSMTDEGIYRCEASNPHGTAKTQATGHVEGCCRWRHGTWNGNVTYNTFSEYEGGEAQAGSGRAATLHHPVGGLHRQVPTQLNPFR